MSVQQCRYYAHKLTLFQSSQVRGPILNTSRKQRYKKKHLDVSSYAHWFPDKVPYLETSIVSSTQRPHFVNLEFKRLYFMDFVDFLLNFGKLIDSFSLLLRSNILRLSKCFNSNYASFGIIWIKSLAGTGVFSQNGDLLNIFGDYFCKDRANPVICHENISLTSREDLI